MARRPSLADHERMSGRTYLLILTFIGLSGLGRSARAGEPPEATVSISLAPLARGLSVHLRRPGGQTPDSACDGPCVVHVAKGRYELGVVDDRGHITLQSLDLSRSETIEVQPTHHRLAVAGAAMLATGAVVVGVGAGVFVYGAVNNLSASGCETPCGAVSGRVLRGSLIGIGAGLALAAIGGVLVFSSDRPNVVERAQVASIRSRARATGRFAIALLPGFGAPTPVALAGLTF
jgi:hypothetical protein